jgi:hypothetical protein
MIYGFYATPEYIIDSNGKILNSVKDLFDYTQSINCFYNLNFNVACILKLLKVTGLKELYETTETKWDIYTLKYIKDKYFSIRNDQTSKYVEFCDISQYIVWHVAMGDKAYSLQKAKRAKYIGEQIYNALTKLGLKVRTMTSPIRVYEKGYFNRLDLPTIKDLPNNVAEFAYACCHGGWIEVFKKGHFENTWDYDLSSAYPYQLSKLKELRFGQWVESRSYQSDADYGFVLGDVTINSNFSPIMYDGKELTFTPMGHWRAYLTKQEIDIIYKYNLGTFEIIYGYWWVPRQSVYPLKIHIDKLYAKKEIFDNYDKHVVKVILNGMWGKLLEIQQGEPGRHFNPVWGSLVESQTRLEVFKSCMDNQTIPLSIAVDGVLTDKPLNLTMGGLGNWKQTLNCPALVISSGIVALRDKEKKHDFSLDYSWLIEQIKENPSEAEYTMKKLSPISLDKAINTNLDDLGTIKESTRSIDVTYESKRLYPQYPTCGKDLLSKVYSSVALDTSIIKNIF